MHPRVQSRLALVAASVLAITVVERLGATKEADAMRAWASALPRRR